MSTLDIFPLKEKNMSITKVGEHRFKIDARDQNGHRIIRIFRGTNSQAKNMEIELRKNQKVLRSGQGEATTFKRHLMDYQNYFFNKFI
jgi:hypothetical protein